MDDPVHFFLLTKVGCHHCQTVYQSFLPKYEDKFTNVGVLTKLHISKQSDLEKIPKEVIQHANFVPMMYAIYKDGSFVKQNPLEMKNVDGWIEERRVEGEIKAGPKMVLLILMQANCGICVKWKESGDLDKFIKEKSELYQGKLEIVQFRVDGPEPKKKNELVFRKVLVGVGTPYLIAVPYDVWLNPDPMTVKNFIYPSTSDAHVPDKTRVNRWLDLLMSDEGLSYYLLLTTSDGCPACRAWKASGDQDVFVKRFSNLDGVLLVHGGYITRGVSAKIPHYPSLMLVPREEWQKINPKVIMGPDPRDPDSVEKWLKMTRWSNQKQFIPSEYPKSTKGKSIKRQVVR